MIDIVDGQQRITTLILLLKSIAKRLDEEEEDEKKIFDKIDEILLPDGATPLLQTNHDTGGYFSTYLRESTAPPPDSAKTAADQELFKAIKECDKFVNKWKKRRSLSNLVSHLNNRLFFILYELEDEGLVYTTFEVLNSRGLDVSWFDRLKSLLMAVVFESEETIGKEEIISQIHKSWSEIYRIVGLNLRISSEALRFAVTLRESELARPLGEEYAAISLLKNLKSPSEVLKISEWIKEVANSVSKLDKIPQRNAVTGIVQARMLAVAVDLNKKLERKEKDKILEKWEKITFRIFGMCRKDARTAVGDYVRLSCKIYHDQLDVNEILDFLSEIGKEHSINTAIDELREKNCYEGWDDELKYFFFKYEKYLAQTANQNFTDEQWERIWEARPKDSIEHIAPQSSCKDYIHWLGNLTILPLGINAELRDKPPKEKCKTYRNHGLLISQQVAKTIRQNGGKWGRQEIRNRENNILKWAEREWGD